MSFVCLWIPDWPTGAARGAEPSSPLDPAALAAAFVRVVPRVVFAPNGIIWADARGLLAPRVAATLVRMMQRRGGSRTRAGVARTAIVAEVAARHAPATGGVPVVVPPAGERNFLAPYPIEVLAPPPHLAPLLADVGIERCGDLARIERGAVEVRLGREGVALWRLARADDPRLIFGVMPRTRPSASVAWTDYTLRDGERLLFVINRLATSVCAELWAWGEGTRAMALDFVLADNSCVILTVHTARVTANRATWMRRIRAELERVRLADAVTGITLRVEGVIAATAASQGDLFDHGFARSSIAEDAVAQIVDDGQGAVAEIASTAHPLPERSVAWRGRESAWLADATVRTAGERRTANVPRLVLQALVEPRRIDVTVAAHRGRRVPTRYRDVDGRDVALLVVAGPDRISSGIADFPYAREYFHGVTADGGLVLLYRDALSGAWYLHGWWD